jgi:hypothetical protein
MRRASKNSRRIAPLVGGLDIFFFRFTQSQLLPIEGVIICTAKKIAYRLPSKGLVESLEPKNSINRAELVRVKQTQHLVHCYVAVRIPGGLRHSH